MTKVDLITGFLGEGKTTFLKSYGDWLNSQDISFAVLENEFGAAGVDAALLENQGIEVRELSGGCICCTLPVGFHDTLLELSHNFDRVLVEPSGIFDPTSFFRIMESPEVAKTCDFGAMLTIVDSETLKTMNWQDRIILAGEVQHTGQIVASKVDQLTDTLRGQMVEELYQLLQEYTQVTKQEIEGLIYPKPLRALTAKDYAMLQQKCPLPVEGEVPTMNHAMLFQSTTLCPEQQYTKEVILQGLQDLTKAGEVVRAKGYLKGAWGGFFVNYTPGGQEVLQTEQIQSPMLNVIGRRLERRKINEIFR